MGNENQDKKQDQQGTQKGGASDSPGQQGQQPGRANSPAKGQEPARQEDVQKPGLEGEVGGGGGGQSGGR